MPVVVRWFPYVVGVLTLGSMIFGCAGPDTEGDAVLTKFEQLGDLTNGYYTFDDGSSAYYQDGIFYFDDGSAYAYEDGSWYRQDQSTNFAAPVCGGPSEIGKCGENEMPHSVYMEWTDPTVMERVRRGKAVELYLRFASASLCGSKNECPFERDVSLYAAADSINKDKADTQSFRFEGRHVCSAILTRIGDLTQDKVFIGQAQLAAVDMDRWVPINWIAAGWFTCRR